MTHCRILSFLGLLLVLVLPSQAAEIIGTPSKTLRLEVSKGVLMRLEKEAGTIFIANPGIADVQVKSPRLIYLTGKAAGATTLYILDEPTTGLHFDDIAKLLAAFRKLLEAGHTVLVIEHNLDVIKTADWIIDLGPEGGDAGGQLVVAGPPELVAQHEASHTGRYLRDVLASGRPNAYATERS